MAQELDALASAISNRQAILFAGAGVSMSIGLPSWRQLIEHMGKELNIRLLLHRLWKTWQQSRLEKDRPISCVFMAHSDPVQEAVLGQWGIVVISGNGQDGPQEALIRFLSELQESTRAQR